MIRIPRIALFRAEPPEHQQLLALFQRNEFSLREISSCAEMRELVIDEESPFDAAVIPMKLADGGSGLHICVQLRSEEDLAATPILVTATGKERSVIGNFYSAGADVVLLPPFDADLLFLQLSALGRQKRAFDEIRRADENRGALKDSTLQALNTSREGLIVMDTAQEIMFCNEAGRFLLGLSDSLAPEETRRVLPQFQQIVTHFSRSASPVSQERALVRSDGQSFPSLVRVTALYRADNYCSGHAVAFVDQSEVQFISESMLQARRAQALALTGAAGALELITAGGAPALPGFLSRLADRLGRSAPRCDVDLIVSILLEALDPVISPQVGIKLSVPQGLSVAVRPSHLFQLAGYLLFEAIEFTGLDGEVTIQGEPRDEEEDRVSLTISSQSTRRQAVLANDPLSSAIQEARARAFSASATSHESALGIGLEGAQAIADRYGAAIEYREESSTLLRLRVRLPAR